MLVMLGKVTSMAEDKIDFSIKDCSSDKYIQPQKPKVLGCYRKNLNKVQPALDQQLAVLT